MPTFTAGHFEALGAAVRIARNDIRDKEPQEAQRDLQDGVSYAVERIADALARGNPRFDRERFLKACEVMG